MSILTAKKSQVIQVAHDLLDPLMENVHRDIENLRAQIVAQEKQAEKLRAEYKQAAKEARAQMRRHEQLLGKVLARLAELENRR